MSTSLDTRLRCMDQTLQIRSKLSYGADSWPPLPPDPPWVNPVRKPVIEFKSKDNQRILTSQSESGSRQALPVETTILQELKPTLPSIPSKYPRMPMRSEYDLMEVSRRERKMSSPPIQEVSLGRRKRYADGYRGHASRTHGSRAVSCSNPGLIATAKPLPL